MNLNLKGLILTVICSFLLEMLPAFSQKKAEVIISKWADKPIIADGLLDDWPDTLSLYNKDAGIYYSLSNDSQNIYLAMRSISKESVTRILVGGISFSANIESRKKEVPTVTFPIADRTQGRNRNTKGQPGVQDGLQQLLSHVKDIKVEGFKEIIDGGISLENTYGIRAAATFDQDHNLVQEIIIPIRLLNLNTDVTDPITYRIKINGIPEPPSRMSAQNDPRQRMGGMYGGGMYSGNFPQRLPQNKLLSSKEFYIKSSLATRQ